MRRSGSLGDHGCWRRRAVGVAVLCTLVVGTAAACSPGGAQFSLQTDGASCEFVLYEHQPRYDTSDEYTIPNDSSRLETRLRSQEYSDCDGVALSERDASAVHDAVGDYDLRETDGFSRIVIREQSPRAYRLFQLRATLVNAYPCDCEAYRHVRRYDGWTAYERARDCGNTVGCGTVLPGTCLLGALLVGPFVLLAPIAAAGGVENGRPRRTELGAAAGLGVVGALFHGFAGGLVVAVLGLSVGTVVRYREVFVETLSTRALGVVLVVVAALSLLNLAVFAASVGLGVTALVFESGAVVVGYLAYRNHRR